MSGKYLRVSVVLASALLAGTPAWAGPCSDDIAALGRQLSEKPQLGPATTGTLTGSNPGSRAGGSQAAGAGTKGTTASADARVGGTAGTKELDAASSNVATSPADVRQQQLGKPTAAQAAAGSNSTETHPGAQASNSSAQDDHVSRAKAAWQEAVDLNAKNDAACKGAVARAQDALKAS